MEKSLSISKTRSIFLVRFGLGPHFITWAKLITASSMARCLFLFCFWAQDPRRPVFFLSHAGTLSSPRGSLFVALCNFTRSRRRSVRGKAGAARTARCTRAEADAEGWAPAHQANWTYNVRPAIGFSLYSLQNFKLIWRNW